jgi:hypothetical protein
VLTVGNSAAVGAGPGGGPVPVLAGAGAPEPGGAGLAGQELADRVHEGQGERRVTVSYSTLAGGGQPGSPRLDETPTDPGSTKRSGVLLFCGQSSLQALPACTANTVP